MYLSSGAFAGGGRRSALSRMEACDARPANPNAKEECDCDELQRIVSHSDIFGRGVRGGAFDTW